MGSGKLTRREVLKMAAVLPLVKEPNQIELIKEWSGPVCRSRVVNHGRQAVSINEVVVFDLPAFPAETRLYAEGFLMLSQTGGTLGSPVDYGNYTDAKHYK